MHSDVPVQAQTVEEMAALLDVAHYNVSRLAFVALVANLAAPTRLTRFLGVISQKRRRVLLWLLIG